MSRGFGRGGRGIDGWKVLWSIAVIGFFSGVVMSVFAGDDRGQVQEQAEPSEHTDLTDTTVSSASAPSAAAGDTATVKEPVIEKTDEGCLADAATLEDLKRQKRELEARGRELAARESELKARELALSDEMAKLADARDEIGKADGAKKKEAEAKVTKLVETLESMSPKAAAPLVASLDEALAVQAMSRLSTTKLAKLMNVMDPIRSTRLSEIMAGVTRAKRRGATPTGNGGSASATTSDDSSAVTSDRAKTAAAGARAPSFSTAASGSGTRNPSDREKGGKTNDGKDSNHKSAKSGDGAGSSSGESAAVSGEKGEVAHR